MKCAVNEIFGPTIQGEGLKTGKPSVFLRTNGCNLRCCFKNSICDTAYTSHTPEPPAYTDTDEVVNELARLFTENPLVEELVITGGEPMLQQRALVEILEGLGDRGHWPLVTIETNGTIPLEDSDDSLGVYVDLWSVSPKLSTSCCFEGYDVPVALQKKHAASRINYEAIASMVRSQRSIVQLKFVYSGPEVEQEVREWLHGLNRYLGCTDDTELNNPVLTELDNSAFTVMLMPEGESNEKITANARGAVEACIRNGWTYTDRIHVRIWGTKRGV